jgi:hypothetical protein
MKKLQYTTNDPSATTDYLAADNTWKTIPGGGGGGVPYTGATSNVDLGEYGLDAGFVSFDTTPTGTPTTQGTMSWDTDHNTVQLVMNGTTGRILEDVFYIAKNQTGSTIPKGTVVRADGTLGASGRIKIAPFLADGTYPSEYLMGVTAEAIANGADGMVVHFGQIRNVNTSAYSNGDILYASTTSAGAFTTTIPSAPNNIIEVAIVIHAAANGTLQVRPTIGSNINKDEGVVITSPSNGQVLTYNSTTSLWENQTPTTSVSKSILNQNHGGVAIAGNTTSVGGWSGVTTFAPAASEFARNTIIPVAGTLKNWAINVGNQPSTGNLVFTLRVNSVTTAMTITIAAFSLSGKYYNTTTSVSVAQGDLVSFQAQNNASTSTGAIVTNSIMYEI